MNNSNQLQEYYFTTLISLGQIVIGCCKDDIWKLFPYNEIIDYTPIPEESIDENWLEIYLEDVKLVCMFNKQNYCNRSMFFFDYSRFNIRSFIEYCNKFFLYNNVLRGWEMHNYSLAVIPCHDDIAFLFTKHS